MANPADLDLSSSVSCKRCAALLQAGERFCPFCGEEQSTMVAAARSGVPIEPGHDALAEGDAAARMRMDFADTVQPEALESLDEPAPKHAATEEADPEIGLVRPGALWHKETSPNSGKGLWAGSFAVPKRLVIGIAAALILLALALLLGRARLDTQDEAERLRDFRTHVEQAQSALNRGDLSAAAQLINLLDSGHADDPGVQALSATLDQRVQERVKRQQLLDAALKASRALRLDEASAPPAQAPTPPEAPIVAAPAPAVGTAAPDGKACSEALAALALCAQK